MIIKFDSKKYKNNKYTPDNKNISIMEALNDILDDATFTKDLDELQDIQNIALFDLTKEQIKELIDDTGNWIAMTQPELTEEQLLELESDMFSVNAFIEVEYKGKECWVYNENY